MQEVNGVSSETGGAFRKFTPAIPSCWNVGLSHRYGMEIMSADFSETKARGFQAEEILH